MSSLKFYWLASVVALAAAKPAFAQNSGSSETRQGNVNSAFQRNTPDIGQPVPDVEVYNAAGNKLSLRELEGDYKVLVFGCLT